MTHPPSEAWTPPSPTARYPWELRDPGTAVDDITRQHLLRAGQVIVGLFELPSSIQRVLDTTLAYEGAHAPAESETCAELLREASRDLFGPRLVNGAPRHAFVTVVVRTGDLTPTDDERRWLLGWRDVEHRLPVYTGALLVLTEQGWSSPVQHLSGHHPVLAA